jgi:hypothetical protein
MHIKFDSVAVWIFLPPIAPEHAAQKEVNREHSSVKLSLRGNKNVHIFIGVRVQPIFNNKILVPKF